MAVTSVSLGPALRAWSMSGITHILCDEPVETLQARADQLAGRAVFSRVKADRELAFSPGSNLQAQPHSPDPATIRPQGAPTGAARRGDVSLPAYSPAQPLRHAIDNAAAAPSAVSGADVSSGPQSLVFASRKDVPQDPATWPAPWCGWAAKIVPAPALWTYHELGADLTGIGRSAERSAFLKNLIAELRLPKGSSVFWPSAMPAGNSGTDAPALLQANAAVFSAGIARLSPQVVIVFGDQALSDIGLDGAVRCFGQSMVEGRLLLLLPEIHMLLRNQNQRASTVSLLRAVIASVNF